MMALNPLAQRMMLEQTVRGIDDKCRMVSVAISEKAYEYARELQRMTANGNPLTPFQPVFVETGFSELTPDIVYHTFFGFNAPMLGIEEPITELEYLPIEQGPRIMHLTTRYATDLDNFLETRHALTMIQRGAHGELDRHIMEHEGLREGERALVKPATSTLN